MRKVSWPTQKQAIVYTITVVILSLAIAAFLGVFDYMFAEGLQYIL